MSNLYSNLANVYDEIYQTIFDYDAEFEFYDSFLTKNNIKDVIEIGCGTGNLAKRFVAKNYTYLGVDLSQNMLNFAAKKVPSANFQQGNVCELALNRKSDSVLITGRTISYLLMNKSIMDAFRNLYLGLNSGGVLIFDAIDASALFRNFIDPKTDELTVEFNKNEYKRISKSTVNLASGWTWDWESSYFKKDKNGHFQNIGDDFATLRAFTKDEIILFLNYSGFELLEITPKQSYAWKDDFYIAKKI
jgi:ubiquinone/menaquinone biosynthesis C-methylase UbiE